MVYLQESISGNKTSFPVEIHWKLFHSWCPPD